MVWNFCLIFSTATGSGGGASATPISCGCRALASARFSRSSLHSPLRTWNSCRAALTTGLRGFRTHLRARSRRSVQSQNPNASLKVNVSRSLSASLVGTDELPGGAQGRTTMCVKPKTSNRKAPGPLETFN
ncbi:hypothetical protein EYF80_017423 [Liparis tanakae]|uniref:Secreted protein n=1 Tax=Liparis tanakae TaxID=230148 RepID=A0A4Z2I509_9TELE|nr:hypothetical protein EYF80_017423 [Liparis tanakae]